MTDWQIGGREHARDRWPFTVPRQLRPSDAPSAPILDPCSEMESDLGFWQGYKRPVWLPQLLPRSVLLRPHQNRQKDFGDDLAAVMGAWVADNRILSHSRNFYSLSRHPGLQVTPPPLANMEMYKYLNIYTLLGVFQILP